LNVHFRSPQTHSMPPWVRRVFIHLLPRLLIMKRPAKETQSLTERKCNGYEFPLIAHQIMTGTVAPMLEYNSRENGNLAGHSCKIHGFQHSSENLASNGQGHQRINNKKGVQPQRHNGHQSAHSHNHHQQRFEEHHYDPVTHDDDGSHSSQSTPLHSSLRNFASLTRCPEVTRAIDGIKYIASVIKSDEESNEAKEDWKFVAMVMDRLFLWIFTVAVLVGTAGIILQAPTLYDTRPAIDEELSEIEAINNKPDVTPIGVYPTTIVIAE